MFPVKARPGHVVGPSSYSHRFTYGAPNRDRWPTSTASAGSRPTGNRQLHDDQPRSFNSQQRTECITCSTFCRKKETELMSSTPYVGVFVIRWCPTSAAPKQPKLKQRMLEWGELGPVAIQPISHSKLEEGVGPGRRGVFVIRYCAPPHPLNPNSDGRTGVRGVGPSSNTTQISTASWRRE